MRTPPHGWPHRRPACELRFNEVQLETGAWAELRALAEARDRYRVDQRSALHEQRSLLELTWPQLPKQVPAISGSHLQAALGLGLSPVAIAKLSREDFSSRLRAAHTHRSARHRRLSAPRPASENPLCRAAARVRWRASGPRDFGNPRTRGRSRSGSRVRPTNSRPTTACGWRTGACR